ANAINIAKLNSGRLILGTKLSSPFFKKYASITIIPINAKCPNKGSTEFGENVMFPIDVRERDGTNPVFNSVGNSSKREMKDVSFFCDPLLIIIIPPTIATNIPTVAEVYPSVVASCQPSASND